MGQIFIAALKEETPNLKDLLKTNNGHVFFQSDGDLDNLSSAAFVSVRNPSFSD